MSEERLWSKNFVVLMVVQMCDLLTYYMVTPIVAQYATEQGASIVDAGILAGSFMLVAILARPFSGYISDRVSRKRVIFVTIAGACVALFGYAASPGLGWFLAFRVLHGFSYAVFGTAVAAAATNFLPESRRGEGLGYLGLTYVLGGAAGPAIGVFVSDAFGYTALFAVTGVVMLGNLALCSTLGKTPVPEAAARKRLSAGDFVSVKALPFLVIIACFCLNWGIVNTFIVLVGEARGVAGIALFFTFNAIALGINRPIAGRIADRKGLSVVYYPAVVCEAVAMAGIAFAQSLLAFVALGVLKAFGQGAAQPALQARCASLESEERAGVAMSTFLLGTDIGYGLGPVLGGAVAASAGYEAMFLVSLPIMAVALLTYVAWSRSLAKSTKGNSAR